VLVDTPWSRPDRVGMCVSNRLDGQSISPFDSLNLGFHVGDDPKLVAQNRSLLDRHFNFGNQPVWLDQVHGNEVFVVTDSNLGADSVPSSGSKIPKADAAFTKLPNVPLVIMSADCLPILVCNAEGSEIAAIHAGWKGLANGIIEKTLSHFSDSELLVYLGPAIAVCHYEVSKAFRSNFPSSNSFETAKDSDHWMFDLYAEAGRQFALLGVNSVSASRHCTHCDPALFSYRRDGETGRFASYIWLS